MKKTFKNFPFDPGRWPFFYGWMILGLGTLGMLMSVPGQTVGVSVFTDYLITELNIPGNLLSLAYLAGTVLSALLLTRAGRFYDRYGARIMGVIVSFALGCVLVYFSFSDVISLALQRMFPFIKGVASPFIVMSIGFFLLRFTGQGSLTMVSRNAVMEWFEKRRGFANGILGVAVSFGFSYAPFVLNALIQAGGWRWAWRFLALLVGAGFTFLVLLFFRDKPENHNLVPDGNKFTGVKRINPETVAVKEFTLQEARRTLTFWIFTLSLCAASFLTTAFT
ncbi:MAG: MFS transporter, partial [Spirochaetales bacterium]